MTCTLIGIDRWDSREEAFLDIYTQDAALAGFDIEINHSRMIGARRLRPSVGLVLQRVFAWRTLQR